MQRTGERYRRDGHGHRAKVLLPGQRFGALVVVKYVGKKRKVGLLYECRCDCGKTITQSGSLLRFGRISCGCYQPSHRKGAENPSWKGGRWVAPHGYVYVASDHPNTNRRGYALEHVLVMSKKIGRPLVKGECVHHKNGVRSDNRPENLELWSKSQPAGQRVSDLVNHAIEILSKYAPYTLSGKCVESGAMLA